jgi:hypothetical protein
MSYGNSTQENKKTFDARLAFCVYIGIKNVDHTMKEKLFSTFFTKLVFSCLNGWQKCRIHRETLLSTSRFKMYTSLGSDVGGTSDDRRGYAF